MKRKFWNWIRNETNEERTLVLNGEISDETWFGDEVTPVCEGAEYRSRRCHSLDQLSGRGCVCGSTDLQHAHGVQGECDGEGGCAGGFCGLCHCYGRNHGADVPGGHDDDPQSHDHCHRGFQGDAEGRGDAGRGEGEHYECL